MTGPGMELEDVLADVVDVVERAAAAGTIRWTDAAELLRLTERVLWRDLDREFEIAWHNWRTAIQRGPAAGNPALDGQQEEPATAGNPAPEPVR